MEGNIYFLELLNNMDIFLLILVRLIGFFTMLPVFSGTSVPAIVKVMFYVVIAQMIFTTGIVTSVAYNDSLFGLVALLVKEFIVGVSMSFVVYIIFTVMYMAGQFIDMQIGYSMVSIFDPVTQIQVPITGNMLNIFCILLLIRSGGFNSFVAAIVRSFDILPIGSAIILGNGFMSSYIIELVMDYFSLGVQIAMPVLGTILVIDVSLGLLVKAAPSMNVFVVGLPIKMLIGLVILYFVIPVYANVYEYMYEQAYKALLNVIGGLSP